MLNQFVLVMIRWRAAVLICAAAWAIFGAWIAWRTPIDALPDLSDNQVLVYTPWIGHDPPEIEASVTKPLSNTLRNIKGLRSLRGSSDVGFSLIHCIFEDNIRFDEARRRVQASLASREISLPLRVSPQLAFDGIPTGQIVWYTLSGIGIDLVELRRWQDEFVRPRLSQLHGVAEVSSVGGMLPEIQVAADPVALANVGLSIGRFEEQLRSIPPALHTRSSLRTIPANGQDRMRVLGEYPINLLNGTSVPMKDLCRLTLQAAPRQGIFEKDGSELVAGIVHLRTGENPLQVTRTVLNALRSLSDELPNHLRVSPCYDRSALIQGAVATLWRTLLEALVVTSLGIWLIMRHLRTSLVIGLTVPLSVLGAFIGMSMLTRVGSTLNINIMSLAGIAISIGVLVDSSIVIVDNITHHLKKHFRDSPVVGDTSLIVAEATTIVAWPALFAIMIMLVSFLPFFVLEGIDGKMIRPLAWTKTLTLVSVMGLTLTVVPALSSYLIRGNLRNENESSIVRSVAQVYRPCLLYLFDRPWPLVITIGSVVIAAAAVTGHDWLVRIATVSALGATWLVTKGLVRIGLSCALLVYALTMQSTVKPIQLAIRLPLDEGMVMDMPITLPRMNASQAADDLKARNMILCRFPEVRMVTGKAGRADTAFDPAPMDMIETMVEFRPREFWPRRHLLRRDARRQAASLVREMANAGLVERSQNEEQLIDEIVDAGLNHFNSVQREFCWHMLQTFERKLSQELSLAVAQLIGKQWYRDRTIATPLNELQLQMWVSQVEGSDQIRLAQQTDAVSTQIVVRQLCIAAPQNLNIQSAEFHLADPTVAKLKSIAKMRWSEFVEHENQLLYLRSGRTWTQVVVHELCERCLLIDDGFADCWDQVLAARYVGLQSESRHHANGHSGMPSISELPIINPHPVYDSLITSLSNRFSGEVWLWPHNTISLSGPSGELDAALQMPGWANVWTRPIQNRIDMLSTGVNSEVGVRVIGNELASVVQASEVIAEILRHVPGAINVLADPVRDKDYTDITIDEAAVAQNQLDIQEVRLAIDACMRGHVVAPHSAESNVIPMRLTVQQARGESQQILDAKIPLRSSIATDLSEFLERHALRKFASLQHRDGPATIKSENGQLRNYVRLNVRNREISQWVFEAKREIENLKLPEGIRLEWTGQYEHAARTRNVMQWVIPSCVILIALLLFGAFFDVIDAMLMLLSVPGALAGAVLCQWLLGYPLSLAVGVGYIACFGMAAATSMVMLVYLRQALADAGGLEVLTLDKLKSTVIDGAVQRLRPKLLTETTMFLGLAPMIWSTGVGADVIQPMAAPVLGGILIADEVVDLLIPVLFYVVRRHRWLRRNHSRSKVEIN